MVAMGVITQKEAGVLDLLVTGMTNAQIAERLGKSKHTVRAQLRHLTAKTKMNNRVQLAMYWQRSQRKHRALIAYHDVQA